MDEETIIQLGGTGVSLSGNSNIFSASYNIFRCLISTENCDSEEDQENIKRGIHYYATGEWNYAELLPSETSVSHQIWGPSGTLTVGNTFSLYGSITEGDYPLVKITTQIKEYNGIIHYSFTDIVNGTYNLYNSLCDYNMLFNYLPAGCYEFKVYATENKNGYESTSLIYNSFFEKVA